MIPLSRYSVMHILGSSPEASEIYMISREVNIVRKNREGICCIIMMDVSTKIKCSPFFVFNSIEHHENNRQGSYFFNSQKNLGQNPPTIKELKEKIRIG